MRERKGVNQSYILDRITVQLVSSYSKQFWFCFGIVEGLLFFGMSDFFSWIVVLIGVVISIILIRTWSTEWNEKFEKD